MKKSFSISLVALMIFFATGTAGADDVYYGPTIGTFGLGMEVKWMFAEKWGLRLAGNYLADVKRPYIGSGQNCYDTYLSMYGVAAYVDWHPRNSGFKVSTGLALADLTVDLEKDFNRGSVYQIGSGYYTGDQIGNMKGVAKYNPIVPYLGIGYDKKLGASNWFLDFDLGVYYFGRARVELMPRGTGGISSGDLDAEEDDMEDCLTKKYGIYPGITLSFKYYFN